MIKKQRSRPIYHISGIVSEVKDLVVRKTNPVLPVEERPYQTLVGQEKISMSLGVEHVLLNLMGIVISFLVLVRIATVRKDRRGWSLVRDVVQNPHPFFITVLATRSKDMEYILRT
jgi:hypothetical protein